MVGSLSIPRCTIGLTRPFTGRVSKQDIQHELNVDMSHIQSCIDILNANDSRQYLTVHDELLSRNYMDRLSTDLVDFIESKWCVSIEDICAQFQLPSDFILAQLEDHSAIYSFNAHHFYTRDYQTLMLAKLRGYLRATTHPTPIKKVFEAIQCNPALGKRLLDMAKKDIPGQVVGKDEETAMYIPNLYQEHQRSKLVDEWYSFGYICKLHYSPSLTA